MFDIARHRIAETATSITAALRAIFTHMNIYQSSIEVRDALMGDDVLGVVVRGHLHLEAAVLTLIEALLPYPKEIDLDRTRFGMKVDLAHALGLTTDLRSPLKVVDKIRNRFAHTPGAKLESDEINSLYGSLSAPDREMLLAAFDATERESKTPINKGFRELNPKEQFLFIVFALHIVLTVVIDETKKT